MKEVCSDSPAEHLQPFKDKMEAFVLSGEWREAHVSRCRVTNRSTTTKRVLSFCDYLELTDLIIVIIVFLWLH